MMHLVQGLLVAAGLLGALAGVAQYLPVRPWRTDVGRHLLAYMLAVAALYGLVTVNMLAGHYRGRGVVTIAVAVVLDIAVWWRWWLVRRARSRTGARHG